MSTPPIIDLDLEKVGRCLVNALTTSAMLGHASVEGTLRDYIKPHEVSPEARFVRDVFTRHTDDAAAAWFGDSVTASAYSIYAVEEILQAAPEPPLPRPEDRMSNHVGWFADLDEDQKSPMWQPCLQAQGGVVTNLDISFTTEQDCLDFIRTEVLGCGMFDEEARP